MKGEIKVTGDKKIDKALSEFEENVQKRLKRKALRAAAKVARDLAIDEAPEDTGFLKKNIAVAAIPRGNFMPRGFLAIAFGPKNVAFYAKFVEFGAAHHAADPFMRVAMRNAENPVFEVFKDELSNLVRETRAT